MPQVIIQGNTYSTYASIDEASSYLIPTSYYATWSALTPDEQAGRLVESTRILDRQRWKAAYDTFEKRVLVEGIVNGSILIAALLASGEADFVANATTASSTKRLKAGSADVEYFRDFSSASNNRFPLEIMEILRSYLGSTGTSSMAGVGGSFVSGVNECSQADQRWGYWSGI